MTTGPIRVSTAGGTSAAFGPSLTGITASASSGSAANAAQASALPGQAITLSGNALSLTTEVVFFTTDASGNRADVVVHPGAVNPTGTTAQVIVPLNAVSGDVRVVGSATAIALQIIPVVSDVQVASVAADGSSAQVLISGLGFVEGANSEYRFGNTVVLDAGTSTGTDVFSRYDPALDTYIANGYVRLTVPLSSGVFGAISVKTAGGTSAAFTLNLASITSVAFSGTPADGSQASANAGQAVTLTGTGLSTATDVLLRWSDVNGTAQMTRLSPDAAAANGTSATLTVPLYANGAFTLQVFGSAMQPLLQIVPTLTSYDQQGSGVTLFGSGYVEGASSYAFTAATVTDTPADPGNIDVYYNIDFSAQNGRTTINRIALPIHGAGNVTVSTAGGTSAALDLNLVQVAVAGTSLGDVAIDPNTGAMWVSDYTSPGHILRIDQATGAVLQTITLTADFGTTYTYNYAGLQIAPSAFSLGGTNVPAGSLLVFNGYANPDRVLALNPASGAIIATLNLAGNYDLAAGVFDPASGHLFVTETNGAGNRLLELNSTDGALINTITVPTNLQSWAGLAIDPVTGNLWLGSASNGNQLVQIDRNGTELRRLDLSTQGINNNETSGLAFAPDGSLWVASTQGVIYRVNV